MRFMMLAGGLVGFAIGIFFGVAHGSAWPDAIWRGSIAALVAGMLLRWWGRLWITSLQAAHRERLAKPATGQSVKNGR